MGTRYFSLLLWLCCYGCAYIGDQNVRVICAVKKLLELVGEHCRERNCSNTLKLTTSICGCVLTIHGSCKDGHVFYWSSSEELCSQIGGKVMLDNLCLAAAV